MVRRTALETARLAALFLSCILGNWLRQQVAFSNVGKAQTRTIAERTSAQALKILSCPFIAALEPHP